MSKRESFENCSSGSHVSVLICAEGEYVLLLGDLGLFFNM